MGVLVFLPTKYSSTQAPTCCACSSASSLKPQRFQAVTSSPLSPTVSSTVKTWQTPQSPRGRCPSSRPEVTSAAELSLEPTTSCPLATATSDLPLSFWEPSIALLQDSPDLDASSATPTTTQTQSITITQFSTWRRQCWKTMTSSTSTSPTKSTRLEPLLRSPDGKDGSHQQHPKDHASCRDRLDEAERVCLHLGQQHRHHLPHAVRRWLGNQQWLSGRLRWSTRRQRQRNLEARR